MQPTLQTPVNIFRALGVVALVVVRPWRSSGEAIGTRRVGDELGLPATRRVPRRLTYLRPGVMFYHPRFAACSIERPLASLRSHTLGSYCKRSKKRAHNLRTHTSHLPSHGPYGAASSRSDSGGGRFARSSSISMAALTTMAAQTGRRQKVVQKVKTAARKIAEKE